MANASGHLHRYGNDAQEALSWQRRPRSSSKPEPVIIASMEMVKLWQTRPEHPEWPDPEAVAKILGL